MNISFRNAALGALTAVALVAGLSQPAAAYCPGCFIGPGIAAGVIGGAMLGAAAANAGPGPVYYGDAPVGDCWVERRPVYDDDGNIVGRRRVRVCR
jgi:hypothetical protein